MAAVDASQPPSGNTLNEPEVDPSPLRQFQSWFDEAVAANLSEPAAMTVATATPAGAASARVVLLRVIDERGFTFFTNYQSRKGRELAANPQAALVFYWAELHRQVRVEGRVEVVSPEESDAYHRSRPRESGLSAHASSQSEVVASREVLEQQVAEVRARYEGQEVPRPPHWGGYRVVPDVIEFWQGRPNRLHDRLRYTRNESGWRLERLAP